MFIRFLILLLFSNAFHLTSFASEKEQEEQHAYKTACEQATFTFQVETSKTSPFFIHFTYHFLPLSEVSAHTQNLLKEANTIVIEPMPTMEDEPLDQLEEAYKVFEEYCVDGEFHKEFQNYMSEKSSLNHYNEIKEKYEKIKKESNVPFAIMFRKYTVGFEKISPFFILHFANKINENGEKQKGMDIEIDNYALKHQKIRTGLDSVLGSYIMQTPRRLPRPKDISSEQRIEINQKLYAQLYYSNHPQLVEKPKPISEELEENRWHNTYRKGQFFQHAFDSDQENSQGDHDCVYERNIKWVPRIEEIITSPERYPSPVMICMGAGHHDMLRHCEEKGYSLKILNQNGTWHSFPYTQLYQRFQKEKNSN